MVRDIGRLVSGGGIRIEAVLSSGNVIVRCIMRHVNSPHKYKVSDVFK